MQQKLLVLGAIDTSCINPFSRIHGNFFAMAWHAPLAAVWTLETVAMLLHLDLIHNLFHNLGRIWVENSETDEPCVLASVETCCRVYTAGALLGFFILFPRFDIAVNLF